MAKHSYLNLVVLSLIIAGCLERKEYKYGIQMKPLDGAVERRLICTGDFSNEELERVAGLYESRIDRHTFSGRFDSNLPNDVGGAGFYSTFNTDMGQAAFYSERFRGDDSVNDTLERVQLIADRCVDFLIGWLEHELGDDPNFASFKAFCNRNVRHDFKNMAIYFWLSGILSDFKGAGYGEIAARMKQYAIERGYLSPDRVHLLGADSDVGEEQIYRLLRQWVADKMDYSSPQTANEQLAFLSDGKRAEESMEQYVRTTDFFAKAWEAKRLKENDPNAEQPDIDVGEFILHDIDFDFGLSLWSETKVEVRLTCTNQLFDTNGEWDEQANQVVWLSTIAGDEQLPTFFYASWSEPNREYQQQHFGRVVLADEDLAQYCIWRENLDEGRGKEWDSFVLSLSPGEDLEGWLNAFRFSVNQQKGPDGQKSDLAQSPRALILAGLKSKEERKDDTETQADEK